MTKTAFIVVLLLLLSPAVGMSEDRLEEAERALDEGLPSVALAKLLSPSALSGEHEARRALALGRAFLATGDPASAEQALATVDGIPHTFWRAEALAALGRSQDALALYGSLAGDEAFGMDATVGAARMLMALGQTGEAISMLEAIPPTARGPRAGLDLPAMKIESGDLVGALEDLASLSVPPAMANERAYLIAQAALLAGDQEAALASLEKIRKAGPTLSGNVVILKARCLELADKEGDAEKLLETFIQEHPAHPALPRLFEALDRIYGVQTSPSSTDLRLWAEDSQRRSRALLAAFYLGLNESRLGRLDRSTDAFLRYLAMDPDGEIADRARALAARNLLSAGNTTSALDLLEGAPGPLSKFTLGLAHAQAGSYSPALDAFKDTARLTNWESAARNAALCAILDGSADEPEGPETDDLRLARCMVLAAERDESAPILLGKLAGGVGPVAASARLALAELLYSGGDLGGARAELARVSGSDVGTADRAAALAVFLADDGSPGGTASAHDAALDFLRRYPSSPLRAEVALKSGEIFFRQGDYAAARAQFEAAAQSGSPPAEVAGFMAAQAAARTLDSTSREEALEMYEDIARAGGPLALRARLAQAFLLNALEKPGEALSVLDKILASSPDQELRLAATIERGDTLLASAPGDAPAAREAIAAWRLAAEPGTPPRWRNQALAKIGAASEQLGEVPAALASYYDAISTPQQEEPEYFWFYKAGFDAARLLEAQGRLSEAIEVYTKLGAKEGPRSDEARQRLNRLRLENFLWED